MLSDRKLLQLRRKEGETDEEFMDRNGLSPEDFQKWKKLTNDGANAILEAST